MSDTDICEKCKTCQYRFGDACPLLKNHCSDYRLELKLGVTICDNKKCKSYFAKYENNCGMVPVGMNMNECVTYQIWREKQ